MLLTTIVTISFDPVEEYEAMKEFEKKHPDWEKNESTLAVIFSRKDVTGYTIIKSKESV